MPIYEYICEKCGSKFELLKKNSSSDGDKCPDCGSDKVIKQLSVFSAVVKEGQSKKCHTCSDFKCPHSGH